MQIKSDTDLQTQLTEHIAHDQKVAKAQSDNAVTVGQLLIIEGSFVSLLIVVIGVLIKAMVNDKLKQIMDRLDGLDKKINKNTSGLERLNVKHEKLKTFLSAKGYLSAYEPDDPEQQEETE